jgi:NADH:ubiquinone oxidoreductase subunit F (NADH-binding)
MPRLLAGIEPTGGAMGLDEHLEQWGALDLRRLGGDLVDEIEASGLVGHGGAWFPVGTKWRSVGSRGTRRPVVVANGAEGEPASSKDALLLTRMPHLVLDGASAAAAALGASRLVVYLPERLVLGLEQAVEARRRRGLDPVEIEVVSAPDAFISGQESAVVSALDGRSAVPSFVGLQPIRVRGVGGRSTLVQNVETLAHVALIARFGAQWFRGLGTEQFPGTMLITVSGRYARPVVMEAPLGLPLRDVLGLSAQAGNDYQGALLGGYGGAWVSIPTLLKVGLTEMSARQWQTTLGAGVVVLLPHSVCPLVEVARVVRYMDQQQAGQCGPCVNGLAALDEAVRSLAFHPTSLRGHMEPILDLCGLVEGRGGCHHPDGVARFVRTACSVFSNEVAAHLRDGPCRLIGAPPVLWVPSSHSAHVAIRKAGT